MKKYFIIPFLLLTLSSAAQIDTAYLPPFVYLTYDSQEWNTHLNLEIDKSRLRLGGIKNNSLSLEVNLSIGDTLITPENLQALLTSASPVDDDMGLLYFKNYGSYMFAEFTFSQDECNESQIPDIFKSFSYQTAFVIINETNLLEINLDKESFFAFQGLQKETIEQIVKNIHIVTPEEIDVLMEYPLSTAKINNELEKKYASTYSISYDYTMKQRKCFDDSYFRMTLSQNMDRNTVDSLLIYAADSTLCNLVATIDAQRDTLSSSYLYRHYHDIGFNFTERTELLRKAKAGEFTLNEYLDFHLDLGEGGSAQRLKDYVYVLSGYEIKHSFDQALFRKFEEKFLFDMFIITGSLSNIGTNRFMFKCLLANEIGQTEYQYFLLKRELNDYKVSPISIPADVTSQKGTLEEMTPPTNPMDYGYDMGFDFDEEFDFYGETENEPFRIQQSDMGNLLYLSTQIGVSKDYSKQYFAINGSNDLKWIKLESVFLDSSKFLSIERIDHQSLSDNSDPSGTYLDAFERKWKAFENETEKSNLQKIIEEEANAKLDSIFKLYSASSTIFQFNLPIFPARIDELIEQNISLGNKAIIQDGIADINNDGFEDIYSILISNGKVIEAKAFLITKDSYQIIGTKAVVKLLKDNSGFKNLLLKSQIGNHGRDFISSDSYYYQATQK